MESTTTIPPFSFAEYLVIFNTFVFGYVTTQFFTGWSSIISHRRELRLSKEHVVWTVFAFLLLTDIWWGSWLKTGKIVEENYNFYISLLSPVVFYFLSVFLFPNFDHGEGKDLRLYIDKEFKRIAFIFVLLFASFLLSSLTFGNVMTVDPYFNLTGIAFSLSLFFFHPSWWRRAVLAIGCLLLLVHIGIRTVYIPGHQVLGFSFIEYLTVFITFIYGFVASRFLYGWGVMFKKFKSIHYNREYMAWTFLAFGLMMDIWWNSWRRGIFIEQSIVNFLFSLSVPLMFYFFSAAIFPIELLNSRDIDLKKFFEEHRTVIFMLLALILLCNFSITNIAQPKSVLDPENLVRLSSIGLAVISTLYRKVWFHRLVLMAGWVFLIAHTFMLT